MINDDGFATDRMVEITPSVCRSGLVVKKVEEPKEDVNAKEKAPNTDDVTAEANMAKAEQNDVTAEANMAKA